MRCSGLKPGPHACQANTILIELWPQISLLLFKNRLNLFIYLLCACACTYVHLHNIQHNLWGVRGRLMGATFLLPPRGFQRSNWDHRVQQHVFLPTEPCCQSLILFFIDYFMLTIHFLQQHWILHLHHLRDFWNLGLDTWGPFFFFLKITNTCEVFPKLEQLPQQDELLIARWLTGTWRQAKSRCTHISVERLWR